MMTPSLQVAVDNGVGYRPCFPASREVHNFFPRPLRFSTVFPHMWNRAKTPTDKGALSYLPSAYHRFHTTTTTMSFLFLYTLEEVTLLRSLKTLRCGVIAP